MVLQRKQLIDNLDQLVNKYATLIFLLEKLEIISKNKAISTKVQSLATESNAKFDKMRPKSSTATMMGSAM